ncbi:MAG: EpsI family protein [Phycisphaerales bacterium]|nr:MAG: EpsI family protein [Phycisphaerales bacterium]
MTRQKKHKRRPLLFAAITAGIVMFTTGIGYRVLAARLAAPVETISLSSEALARLPMQLGDWAGRESPLDDAVVEATDTDAYVSRKYSRANGLDSVWFYIAYGGRARDLMPHRPEVCYTGAGWTPIYRRSTELTLSDGMQLPCNVMQFSRGTLNKERVVVLDYYIVDGEYSHDVSLLRWKAWRGSGTVGYVAQVQIVASVTPTLNLDSAGKSVYDFAVLSAPPVFTLFEDPAESRKSD